MIRYCLFILLIGFAACESRDIDKGDPATSDSAVSQLEPDGTEVEIQKTDSIIKADSDYDTLP